MPKPEGLLTILQGDWIEQLRQIPDESVQMCVTSPPYFGLRDYGADGQLGLEKSPADYVSKLVEGFNDVRRVLKKDGVLFINLGDSYAGSRCGPNGDDATRRHVVQSDTFVKSKREGKRWGGGNLKCPGVKVKDLIGVPWMVAFALRDSGWYLRCDIIWSKPNPMPESVTDRPTRAHEYIFLLSKSPKYYYNHEAIRETPSLTLIKQVEEGYNGHAIKDYLKMGVQDASATKSRIISNARKRIDKQRGHSRRHAGFNDKWDALTPAEQALLGRNKRSVWTVAPANFSEFSVSWVWERHDCEATCGNLHIASLNCPIYGGLFDLVSTALCDGHEGGDCSRIARICDRLSLEPKDGFFPIDQLRAWNFGQQRLDSVLLKHFGIASDHNTETHKTGLFVSTSLSCKPSSQRSSHILSILAEHGLSAPHLDMLLNNTWEGDLSENHNIGSLWSIVDSDRLPDFCAAYGINYKKTPRETSHFATFPTKLIEPCILAGSKAGDVVIDPFAGSGTTGEVALTLGRKSVLIELNPDYIKMIEKRCTIQPGFPFAA